MCVCLVLPSLWGPHIPTRIGIPYGDIFIFGPYEVKLINHTEFKKKYSKFSVLVGLRLGDRNTVCTVGL